MSELRNIIQLMERKGIANRRDLVGVPDAEIRSLEAHLELRFPEVYREYLLTFGRSAGFLTPWMAIYFDDLKEVRDLFDQFNATKELESGFGFLLPADALLVANCESVFDFLVCHKAADPPVIRVDFSSEIVRPKPIAATFTAYLEYLVNSSDTTGFPDEPFDDAEVELQDDIINF